MAGMADRPSPLLFKLSRGVKNIDSLFKRAPNPIPDEFVNPVVIQYDPCNLVVAYDPPEGANTFQSGFKLPKLYFTYRNPACQDKPGKPDPDVLGTDTEFPIDIPDGDGLFFLFYSKAGESRVIDYAEGNGFTYKDKETSIDTIDFPYEGELLIPASFNPSVRVKPQWSITFTVRSDQKYNGLYFNKAVGSNDLEPTGVFTLKGAKTFTLYGDSGTSAISVSATPVSSTEGGYIPTPEPFTVRIFQTRTDLLNFITVNQNSNPPTVNFRRTLVEDDSITVRFNAVKVYKDKVPFEPPPPIKKKKCKCMCCDDKNDDLLKLILKRIGSLPANVPDNFAKQNPNYINVESLAELMLWQMQQLDAVIGAFPIDITIEDNDSSTEGNQTEKVSLPNVAEGIAELLGLLITVKRDTHATLITAVKAMAEAGMSKQLGVKTLDVALANAEFLGYKLEQKEKEIPSLFTPNGANLSETLKEKNIKIITYENTDRKDLQDDLKTLLTMAARWNAQNWRKVGGDVVESLRQTLVGNPELLGEKEKEKKQPDFNDFTEQAERGFIEITGISDSTNPWGRPYNQRPKIREIGNDGGRYDKDGGLLPPA